MAILNIVARQFFLPGGAGSPILVKHVVVFLLAAWLGIVVGRLLIGTATPEQGSA